MQKPNLKPQNPNFSSGPCSKRPGWTYDVLKNSPIGRSHRHKVCKERLNEAIVKSKTILNLPDDYLLDPILGIGDPRYDNRIDFLAGFHGLKSIEDKVNSGQAEVGFALFATQVQNVISFADKKLNMPPKSTWFDPKPLDGLLAYDFE